MKNILKIAVTCLAFSTVSANAQGSGNPFSIGYTGTGAVVKYSLDPIPNHQVRINQYMSGARAYVPMQNMNIGPLGVTQNYVKPVPMYDWNTTRHYGTTYNSGAGHITYGSIGRALGSIGRGLGPFAPIVTYGTGGYETMMREARPCRVFNYVQNEQGQSQQVCTHR